MLDNHVKLSIRDPKVSDFSEIVQLAGQQTLDLLIWVRVPVSDFFFIEKGNRMKYQEIMIVSTEIDSLKAKIYGWVQYDPTEMSNHKEIGLSGGTPPIGKNETPDCVLRAMSNGWHLMNQPIPFKDGGEGETHYEWWLCREKER